MFYGLGLHWSAILVFLAIAVVGLWVAYSFLNKNGLYLFCILAAAISLTLGDVSFFSHGIPLSLVIVPVIHFALLVCLHKHGEKEAKNLFFVTLLSMAIVFVCTFFEGTYTDAALHTPACLTWNFLRYYVSPLLALSVSCVVTFLLASKIKIKSLKKFLILSIFIATASLIYFLLFNILAFAGDLSFVDILLTMLIEIVLICAVSVGLGYFEQFLNREPKPAETPKEEKKEETKKESVNEETNTPEDID